MRYEGQPTNEEIMSALQKASQFPETIPELRALYERRTTWYGADENDLRYEIYKALNPFFDDYPW